jgi:hypothetical protein
MAGRPGTSRYSGDPPVHRLRPVVLVTFVVLGAYAGLQLVAASTMTSQLWWRSEWLRLQLHHKYPKAAFTQPVPGPVWQSWVPSAVTAFVLILVLVLLALALVTAGRGWWLLLAALVPLIPSQIAPGVWAPELSNQVMYAVVWPAGATGPSTAWSWISAAIEVVVIAVPAMVLRSVVLERRAVVHTSDAVRRLLAVALVVGAVIAWNHSAGEPQDWGTLARRGVFFAIGALVVSGSMRRIWVLPFLACLPTVAGGVWRWATGVDGQPVLVNDPRSWALTIAFCLGAVWVFAQPVAAGAVRQVHAWWTAMVAADVERKNARLAARAAAVEKVDVEDTADGADSADSAVGEAAEVRRPSRARPAVGAGRHRA